MLVKFKKPVVFEGKEDDSITLDLDSLNGEAAEAVIAQVVASIPKEKLTPVEIDNRNWRFIAARASGLPPEFFLKLPLRTYMQIKGQVLSFLIESEVEFSFPSES